MTSQSDSDSEVEELQRCDLSAATACEGNCRYSDPLYGVDDPAAYDGSLCFCVLCPNAELCGHVRFPPEFMGCWGNTCLECDTIGVPANVQIDTVVDACAVCLDENQRHVKWIFGECGHSFCIKCGRTLYGFVEPTDAVLMCTDPEADLPEIIKECPLCRGTAPLWYEPGGAGVRPQ
jgi:hypothetical protein